MAKETFPLSNVQHEEEKKESGSHGGGGGNVTPDILVHPNEGTGKPTRVYINVILQKIGNINTADGSVFIRVKLNMHWHDPRMIGFKGDPAKPPGELWGPRMDCPLGTSSLTRTEERPMMIKNVETGHMLRTFIWDGFIQCSPDLREFPLDYFDIDVKFTGISCMSVNGDIQKLHNATHMEWCNLLDAPKDIRDAFAKEKFFNIALWNKQLLEWTFNSIWYSFDQWYAPSGIYYPQLHIKFRVFRNTGFYLSKIMIPLNLLFVITMLIGAFDPLDFENRMNVGATMFLAAVAFLFVVSSDIPKVGYLTKMDYFIVLEILAQFFIIVMSAVMFGGNMEGELGNYLNIASIIFCVLIFFGYQTIAFCWGFFKQAKLKRAAVADTKQPEKTYLSASMF